MTIEPVPAEPVPALALGATNSAAGHANEMRRVLRRQLGLRTLAPATLTMYGIGGSDRSGVRGAGGVRVPTATALGHAGNRPSDPILGFVLPAEFHSIAAIADSVVSTGASKHREATIAVAVTRDGDEACFVDSGGTVTETFQPQGWLVDACRRTVALSTRPTQAHPLDLSLALWLDRIMVEVLQTQTTLTWAAALTLCPVPAQWVSSHPQHLGATLASITAPWSQARARAVAGHPLPVPMTPRHAAWMDDPMFARWCLGYFPDLAELRSDIEFLAPPGIASQVDATIRHAYSVFAEGGCNT